MDILICREWWNEYRISGGFQVSVRPSATTYRIIVFRQSRGDGEGLQSARSTVIRSAVAAAIKRAWRDCSHTPATEHSLRSELTAAPLD